MQWRKNSKAITKGRIKHFIPRNGVYVYFREYGEEKVMIISNNTSRKAKVNWTHYAEELKGKLFGINVISGARVNLNMEYMHIKGNNILILEL